MTPFELAVAALLAGGVFFGVVAVVGVLRLPDLYTRAHAASKSDTLGAVLSLGAVALVFGADFATVKVVFLLVFMFVTNPTAAHAIARAAFDQGIEPWSAAETERATRSRPDADADESDGVATDGGGSDAGSHGSGADASDADASGSDADAGTGVRR